MGRMTKHTKREEVIIDISRPLAKIISDNYDLLQELADNWGITNEWRKNVIADYWWCVKDIRALQKDYTEQQIMREVYCRLRLIYNIDDWKKLIRNPNKNKTFINMFLNKFF